MDGDTECSERIEIEDRWLASPLVAVTSQAIMFLLLILWLVTGMAASYGFPLPVLVFLVLFGSTAELTALASIFTYYKDSKALNEASNNWVPIWWIYSIATFFLGAIIPAIYLLRRVRNTNVDWSRVRAEFTLG